MSKNKIDRSGIIPYYIKDNEPLFLFMVPSNPNFGGSEFQVAKGKAEQDEPHEITAKREGYEELGLLEDNILELIYLDKYLGRTFVYLARIKDPERFIDPHYETGATRWMTNEEFQLEGRDLHKIIVKQAYDRIKNRKQE